MALIEYPSLRSERISIHSSSLSNRFSLAVEVRSRVAGGLGDAAVGRNYGLRYAPASIPPTAAAFSCLEGSILHDRQGVSFSCALAVDAAGTTNYAYDPAGNLQSFTYPNGVSHSYTYDALNRLTNLSVSCGTGAPNCGPGGAGNAFGYAYTLGAA